MWSKQTPTVRQNWATKAVVTPGSADFMVSIKDGIVGANIFISAGSPSTTEQQEFLDALMDTIRSGGHRPRVINKTDPLYEQPLNGIRKVLSQCDGALIAAYERIHIDNGSERRNSKKETQIQDSAITTPWNQIEAAMAYAMGVPILVVCQESVRRDGLLEFGMDWYVDVVPDRVDSTLPPDFVSRLNQWCASLSEAQRSNGGRRNHGHEGPDSSRVSAARASFLPKISFVLGAALLIAIGALIGMILRG
jgi:hypothetical protein